MLEDAENYTYENLVSDFGVNVAMIVRGVTEVRTHDEQGAIIEDWYERKQEYLRGLKIASEGSLLVCAADTTHNLQSLLQTHIMLGDSAWGSFHASIEEKMSFYRSVIGVVSERLKSGITDKLQLAYHELESALVDKDNIPIHAEENPISF